MVGKLVINTGAMVRAQGIMSKAFGQFVLLYGRKSLVVTGDMLKVLEEFHHLLE